MMSRVVAAAGGVAGLTTAAPGPSSASMEGTDWPLWRALPIAPYGKRKTVRTEAIEGKVWTFDQLQGVFYVHVPIRMTVVALQKGGLFVYAPVAPTQECLALLQPLIDRHGPVKHIILPTAAPEHKVLAGPFAKQFPQATFWTTDAQYTFPVPLPSQWVGFPNKVKSLPQSSKGKKLPWSGEFDHTVLTVRPDSQYTFQEAAFFHRPTKSLLLCDTAYSVGRSPPEILTSEPESRRALLYHARDDPLERVEDTPAVLQKGWQRIAVFANFFMPGSLSVLPTSVWLPAAPKSPMPELGYKGVLPFKWSGTAQQSFDKLYNEGKPVVAPIVQVILSRDIDEVKVWLDTVCSWNFTTIMPCHFDAPIPAKPADLRGAFQFLFSTKNVTPFCDEDVETLREIIDSLPPGLALKETPLGSLVGEACGLSKT